MGSVCPFWLSGHGPSLPLLSARPRAGQLSLGAFSTLSPSRAEEAEGNHTRNALGEGD